MRLLILRGFEKMVIFWRPGFKFSSGFLILPVLVITLKILLPVNDLTLNFISIVHYKPEMCMRNINLIFLTNYHTSVSF